MLAAQHHGVVREHHVEGVLLVDVVEALGDLEVLDVAQRRLLLQLRGPVSDEDGGARRQLHRELVVGEHDVDHPPVQLEQLLALVAPL